MNNFGINKRSVMAKPRVIPLVISYLILGLMTIRPMLNQFQEFSFGSISGYEISILSIWSALFIALIFLRMPFYPYLKKSVKATGLTLLFYLSTVGLLQLSIYGDFAQDYLYFVLIVLALMNGHKVFFDLGMEKIVATFSWSAVILIFMHATASIWAGEFYYGVSTLGNYLGAFETKHIAAYSFLVLAPYVYLKYQQSNSNFWMMVLIMDIACQLMTLQRTTIVSLLIGVLTIIVGIGKKRYLLYGMAIIVVVISLIPGEYTQTFYKDKIAAEIEDYHEGDITDMGAGRGGLISEAADIYLNKMNVFEKLVGKGLGFSNSIHMDVVGVKAYVHLQVLQMFVDLGLIGTILVCLFIYQIVNAKIKIYRSDPSMLNLVAKAYVFVFVSEILYTMPFQNGGTMTLLAILAFVPCRKLSGIASDRRVSTRKAHNQFAIKSVNFSHAFDKNVPSKHINGKNCLPGGIVCAE